MYKLTINYSAIDRSTGEEHHGKRMVHSPCKWSRETAARYLHLNGYREISIWNIKAEKAAVLHSDLARTI